MIPFLYLIKTQSQPLDLQKENWGSPVEMLRCNICKKQKQQQQKRILSKFFSYLEPVYRGSNAVNFSKIPGACPYGSPGWGVVFCSQCSSMKPSGPCKDQEAHSTWWPPQSFRGWLELHSILHCHMFQAEKNKQMYKILHLPPLSLLPTLSILSTGRKRIKRKEGKKKGDFVL